MAIFRGRQREDERLKYTSINNGLPAGNPIANVFVIIVGALAIGASIILGFFAFVIVGSIVLVMASIIGLRVWWFKRKLRSQVNAVKGQDGKSPGGVIEGEYRVVADDREGE